MLLYSFRKSLISAAAVMMLASGTAVADAAATATAPPDSLPKAYGVLQTFGLLQPEAPAAPAKKVFTETILVADARAESTPASSPTAVPNAYQVLRRLGLLKPDPAAAAHNALAVETSSRIERVLVDKSERKLYLVRNGHNVREFPISLGAMPRGPKLKAGDLRTPEGTYTLDWRNPKSRFYKSIHISYPNSTDRVRAEEQGVDPGGMIMIHGEHYMPSLRRIYRRVGGKDWTEGCIALNNEYMDELWHTVADGTPIEIRP